jgi:hypothetical protein
MIQATSCCCVRFNKVEGKTMQIPGNSSFPPQRKLFSFRRPSMSRESKFNIKSNKCRRKSVFIVKGSGNKGRLNAILLPLSHGCLADFLIWLHYKRIAQDVIESTAIMEAKEKILRAFLWEVLQLLIRLHYKSNNSLSQLVKSSGTLQHWNFTLTLHSWNFYDWNMGKFVESGEW